jgi:V/A-type H+-transporting ATPase subunit E
LTYEELMASIEATAAERMQEMKEKARAEAEGIRRAAAEKAAGLHKEAMERAKKKVEAEREKMVSRMRGEVRLELLRRKQEVSDRAFREAGERILAARTRPGYRLIARRLAEEAIGQVKGSDIVFHVDPRDRSLFEGILADIQRNCEIATDLATAGGLTVTSKDGRFSVTNTIESRLSRARELLKGEVFSILYGG